MSDYSVSVSRDYVHIVEFGHPLRIGGLTINSGDLLHGDLHGVQSVPIPTAQLIAAAADRIRERERALIALCRSRNFSIERLRALLADEPETPSPG